MTHVSSSLIGVNTTRLFTVLIGRGANGKSLILNLIKLTLGNYCNTIATKLFTRPRPDSQSPDPGLLNLIDSRMVLTSESEIGDKFNSGFIKMITGNDSIELRHCHSNKMIKFVANFKIMMACNDIPDIDGAVDYAFSRKEHLAY